MVVAARETRSARTPTGGCSGSRRDVGLGGTQGLTHVGCFVEQSVAEQARIHVSCDVGIGMNQVARDDNQRHATCEQDARAGVAQPVHGFQGSSVVLDDPGAPARRAHCLGGRVGVHRRATGPRPDVAGCIRATMDDRFGVSRGKHIEGLVWVFIPRRAMGSPITPSAFKGARAAAIGGTALATSLGALPGVRLAEHVAGGRHSTRTGLGEASRFEPLGDSRVRGLSLLTGGLPDSRRADLHAQMGQAAPIDAGATSRTSPQGSVSMGSGDGPAGADAARSGASPSSDGIAARGEPTQADPSPSTDTTSTSGDATPSGTATTAGTRPISGRPWHHLKRNGFH